MNEIISILKKYFNEKDIAKVKKTIEEKQRDTIINDKYFAKVGKNSDKLFFNNLVKEIRLYESNQDNKIMPRFVVNAGISGNVLGIQKAITEALDNASLSHCA
jgi:hypothetical protein